MPQMSLMRTMMVAGIGVWSAVLGCQSPEAVRPLDTIGVANERHVEQFGNFDLPRRIGSVENANLQLPAISPDGEQMLYLRSDHDDLSLMTVFGSPTLQDTPADGTLAIWIRPARGNVAGRRLSMDRWAHSPVWSDSGRSVAYVVNESTGSFIVHHDLATGTEHRLGVSEAINCLPRFDATDDAVLFCSGPSVQSPFRVWRQIVGQTEPVALTPDGTDGVFPVVSDVSGKVFCAHVEGPHLNWALAGVDGFTEFAPRVGTSDRPSLLKTWFGITSPVSPHGPNWLFYDDLQDRVGVCYGAQKRVVRHRAGSIAACWLSDDAIALATADQLFAVNTRTGMSLMLFNGSWIPSRYAPATRRLLLLGQDSPRRFSIVEVVFKPRVSESPRTTSGR